MDPPPLERNTYRRPNALAHGALGRLACIIPFYTIAECRGGDAAPFHREPGHRVPAGSLPRSGEDFLHGPRQHPTRA